MKDVSVYVYWLCSSVLSVLFVLCCSYKTSLIILGSFTVCKFCFISVCFCSLFLPMLSYLSITHRLQPSTSNPSFSPFLFLCLLRICRSCWRWCVFPSSTRPTCWTWWTTRSWSNPRRRAAIWSTRPSAITCCPMHGKRCRRQGLGRGSPLVRSNSHTYAELNWCASSSARMTSEQGGSDTTGHPRV